MFDPNGPTLAELAYQALSSTQRGYDLLADKFDYTPFRTPQPIVASAAKVALERPLSVCLDLCCGTGAFFETFVAPPGCLCLGLDFSPGMLTAALRRTGSGTRFVRADVLDPWPVRSKVDLVTCFGAIGHIPVQSQERFFRAVFKCLSPGGRFLFATATLPRPSEMSFWLSKGFNLAMRLRNGLWPGEFVMYYLTFGLDRATGLLGTIGFELDVRYIFPEPFDRLALVVATKR